MTAEQDEHGSSGTSPAESATAASRGTSQPVAGAEQAPRPSASPPPPAPSGPRSLAIRWRGSRRLRVAAAVLTAAVLMGLGFGAGLAVSGNGDEPHGHGRRTEEHAEHHFHVGDPPFVYRFQHDSRHGDRDGSPSAPSPPAPAH
jgi:hypothetical protein